MFVIKRNGKKEKFSVAKLKASIRRAAKDAGLSKRDIEMLIDQVAIPVIKMLAKKEKINSIQIRTVILRILKKKSIETLHAWIAYEKGKNKKH